MRPVSHCTPSRTRRPHETIEAVERLRVRGRREIGRGDPTDGCDEQNHRRLDRHAQLLRDEEPNRNDERAGHRRDLAPRIDAPPEPAQEVDESRSRADRHQQIEALLRGVENERHAGGGEHEQTSEHAADEHIVSFARLRTNEAPIEIVDDVRRAPVQVRRERRHICGEHAGNHDPEKPGGQKLEHRRICHVMPDQPQIDVREGGGDVGDVGEDDHR